MHNLIDRTLVVLKAAPTYLTALALVAGVLITNLPDLPFDLPEVVGQVLAGAAVTVAVAVAIIRGVTPVLEDARGLLPPDGPSTLAEADLLDVVGQLPPPAPNWRGQFPTQIPGALLLARSGPEAGLLIGPARHAPRLDEHRRRRRGRPRRVRSSVPQDSGLGP